jgi:hypothetical protein
MKSETSLANLIPIFIVVIGVAALAIAIPNSLLRLGDNFLDLFSVTQVFWMGVLWVVVGMLVLLWQRSAIFLRRMIAALIILLGIVGVVITAASGYFNNIPILATFDLTQIFALSIAYIVVGVILLLFFRAES